ncbi:MAG: ATP-dependent RNA helicase RhlB [Bacteroidota bacterium]|nr:ATP-dependent RNA helicase RhlB [Bacteroidota bacterium]
MFGNIIKFVRKSLDKLTKSDKKKTGISKKAEAVRRIDTDRKPENIRKNEPFRKSDQYKKTQSSTKKQDLKGKQQSSTSSHVADTSGKQQIKKSPIIKELQKGKPAGKPKTPNTSFKNKNERIQRPEDQKSELQQKSEVMPLEDHWDSSQFKVDPADGKTRFHDLNLPKEIMHAIYDSGFQYCTPIQAEILFHTLTGKDATGRAQTGTGKTAAFLITILAKLIREPLQTKRRPGAPRALIVAPTRELVLQISDDAKKLSKYTRFRIMAIYGGMDYQKQKKQLHGQSIDILVATPGRLLDFYARHDVHLSQVEMLIIDEADRMLDMGFIPDVRKIVRSTPPKEKRQTLFFSATLNNDVKRLSSYWTKDSVFVDIEPEQVEVETVNQIVYIVTNEEKLPLLFNIITQKNLERVIIFANRRDETRDLYELLKKKGISCSILSGDVDQKQRIRTLEDFKQGKIRVLVATDVAGRGIHIDGVSHVINFTLPQDPEDYVHRIGRTGRAGASGTSISFASEDDSFYIPAIENYIGHSLACTYPEENLLKLPEEKSQESQTSKAETPKNKTVEIKNKEIQAEEVKTKQIKTEGVKTKGVKTKELKTKEDMTPETISEEKKVVTETSNKIHEEKLNSDQMDKDISKTSNASNE